MEHIESAKNPKVKQVNRLHHKKYRERDNKFIIEGEHLIETAIEAGVAIERVFVTNENKLSPLINQANVSLLTVTESIMKEMSQVETPPGLLAVVEMPAHELSGPAGKGMYLLLDAVQDPGNAGTMIRTADAAGLDGVVLGEGTVDPYNDKVIRSTQGSIFHVPVVKGELTEWIEKCQRQRIPVFGSSLQDGTSHTALGSQPAFALLVGNEGAGVRGELLGLTDQNVYLPLYGKAESLNVTVATGILLYHLRP
ncbi:TrmH family RNA methyltransferase [Salsuginibacillus kocurii]|uniref:TrmH family RNA methyltransferase n=1 Tax=Salsuginibacillus kocurii TaxID=427078 RepID=UPI0003753F30|nr:RNA methyltransferase [Salsuginibacillus kocurii]